VLSVLIRGVRVAATRAVGRIGAVAGAATRPAPFEVLVEYCRFFNEARPHQGIAQLVPVGSPAGASRSGTVLALPVLKGLHHDYRRAA
jgi:hypothetical protein